MPRALARRTKAIGAAFAVLAAAMVAIGTNSSPLEAAVPFTAQVLDSGNAGDCKAVGDLDGDNLVDGIIGGASLSWYRSAADEAAAPTKHTIQAAANTEFSTDCQTADMDGDGDLDIVVPDHRNLYLFLNPRPNSAATGSGWIRVLIGTTADWSHDVEIGELTGDGRLDVVTRRKGATEVWIQNAVTSWTQRTVSTQGGEGTALGDVDHDGDVDIVAGATWLEHPGGNLQTPATWLANPIMAVAQGPLSVADLTWGSVAVADMNGNGVNDIVYGPMEAIGRKLAWYEPANADATVWTEHLISPVAINAGLHTLKVADMDNDGDPDVVTARMHSYSPSNISVWTNNGASWSEQVVAGNGLHNLRIADFGNDGDLDIFGANYVGNPPVRLFRNDLLRPGPGGDRTPPTPAGGLSALNVTSSSAELRWTAATDDVAVTGYELRIGSRVIALGVVTATVVDALAADTQHSASLVALDAAGNRSTAATVTFRTTAAADVTPPQVVAFSPQNGSTGVATNTVVEVAFSEPIAPASVGISLATAAGAPVPATVTVSGGTARLTPTGALPAGTTIRVSVAATVTDLAGLPLGSAVGATFSTAAAPPPPPPPPPSGDVLLVSSAATRTGAVALEGATFNRTQSVYIFLSPSSSALSRVEFFLDNVAMSGSPRSVESAAPYDLAGGTLTTANPFSLGSLSVGTHTLTARRTLSTGIRTVVTSQFTVTSGTTTTTTRPTTTTAPTTTAPTTTAPTTTTTSTVPTGTEALLVSTSANRTGAVALQGTTFPSSGRVYIFLTSSVPLTSVSFWLNNPTRSGAARQNEATAPYDFAGGTVSTANAFVLSGSRGTNTVTALVRRANGTTAVINATFTVT